MFEKITKGNSIYAVYNLSDDDEPDRTSMMMVNHSVGKKSGFAPVTFEEMNGHVTRMLFDITGKISLREYIGQNISQNDFRSMIVNIVDAIEQLDEYMIDIQQIKLDIDSVFCNLRELVVMRLLAGCLVLAMIFYRMQFMMVRPAQYIAQ